jgi:hypothetical protein
MQPVPSSRKRGVAKSAFGAGGAAVRSALAQVSVDLVSLQHQISVQDRRAKWRRQKNATDLLNRVTRRPWTIAAVLSCLSQRTSRETPRMYVLWTLLRQRVRDRDGCIGDISEEGIDERIEDILSGAESVEIEAMVLDPNSRFHFLAAKWWAEFKTYLWLIECNKAGASPSSSDMFGRFQTEFPTTSKSHVYTDFIRRIENAGRQEKRWSQTFRKRWQLSFSELPRTTPLSDEQLSERVFD